MNLHGVGLSYAAHGAAARFIDVNSFGGQSIALTGINDYGVPARSQLAKNK
jgi:hypothetical protein